MASTQALYNKKLDNDEYASRLAAQRGHAEAVNILGTIPLAADCDGDISVLQNNDAPKLVLGSKARLRAKLHTMKQKRTGKN